MVDSQLTQWKSSPLVRNIYSVASGFQGRGWGNVRPTQHRILLVVYVLTVGFGDSLEELIR